MSSGDTDLERRDRLFATLMRESPTRTRESLLRAKLDIVLDQFGAEQWRRLEGEVPKASWRTRVSALWTWRREVQVALLCAVSLVVAVAIVWGQWITTDEWSTYTASVGQFQSVELSDASKLVLNTNTKVRVHYSDTRRYVQLISGEMFVDVTHDAKRPFVVEAGDVVVEDIGTRFNVRRRGPTAVDVLVSEGRVRVSGAGQKMEAGAGTLVRVRADNAKPIIVTSAPIERNPAWTHGMLIFHETTLAEAVAEVNRYNTRQIIILDADSASERINGAFIPTNPDRFATAIEKMFGLEARHYESESRSEIRLSKP